MVGVVDGSRRRGLDDHCAVDGLWEMDVSSAFADGEEESDSLNEGLCAPRERLWESWGAG